MGGRVFSTQHHKHFQHLRFLSIFRFRILVRLHIRLRDRLAAKIGDIKEFFCQDHHNNTQLRIRPDTTLHH